MEADVDVRAKAARLFQPLGGCRGAAPLGLREGAILEDVSEVLEHFVQVLVDAGDRHGDDRSPGQRPPAEQVRGLAVALDVGHEIHGQV
eukprot:CAMPEP_0168423366 /NCGR_PEP_ID=MMETSP0228-20121227/34271_1 /TAXON_ID=133427 /ORGANISM="Protoceratium reticulatum, Strain CCCM 535 (=CCMP 1889)" /LENGTH=88 /DNA_ID=CAMNT_0008437325 /DNA_START=131 /DNA_END=394 /DNA_ORIENTATION=-